MILLSPLDQLALEVGRLFIRAHTAEQRAGEAEARLAEFANGVEKPKPARKSRAKVAT